MSFRINNELLDFPLDHFLCMLLLTTKCLELPEVVLESYSTYFFLYWWQVERQEHCYEISFFINKFLVSEVTQTLTMFAIGVFDWKVSYIISFWDDFLFTIWVWSCVIHRLHSNIGTFFSPYLWLDGSRKFEYLF